MEANTRKIYEKLGVLLLELTSPKGRLRYLVLNNGPARFFDDYDDALEEYNLRWMKIEYGD